MTISERKLTLFALCIIGILFYSTSLQAQEEKRKYLSVGISPLGLLDPITPSFNFAIEVGLGPRFNVEFGYGLDLNINVGGWHPNPDARHHKYQVGGKYFIDGHDAKFPNTYLGLSFFSVVNDYAKSHGSFLQYDLLFSFETALVQRRIKGLRFRFGREIQPWDRLLLDFNIGLGIRQLRIDYFSDNFSNGGEFLTGPWFRAFDEYEGIYWKPDAQIGFKISYLISKV